eukprot:scaffold440_cov277-Ochromonas_danica.AAC.1
MEKNKENLLVVRPRQTGRVRVREKVTRWKIRMTRQKRQTERTRFAAHSSNGWTKEHHASQQ